MMKQYTITVNGTAYAVTVEPAEASAPVQSAAPMIPAAPVTPAPPAAAPVSSAATTVCAPMPGGILDVCVAVGQHLKAGEKLFILEAMKMENELFSPCDGVIAKVAVAKGAAVNTDDLLCVIQ